MKKHSSLFLCIFSLCLISALSILYWSNVKEKLIASSSIASASTPLSSVPSAGKMLALTFDLDSESDDISGLLDALDSQQVKATFFITGKWLDANQEALVSIVEHGHELGNHTEGHLDMTSLDEKEQTEQIIRLHNKVLELTGISMTLFRPPFGSYDYSVIRTARQNNYLAVNWSIDSEDWKEYGAADIVTAVSEHPDLANGSIVRFQTQDAILQTALEDLVPVLKNEGY